MLIRYPGSKAKHVKFLSAYFPEEPFHLVEGMCGAAAVSFHLLENNRLSSLKMSDVDGGITSLWVTVRDTPADLLYLIDSFKPSVGEFLSLRESQPSTKIKRAFRKLALHQMSYSGLGTQSGPIGGYAQHGKYKIDCRWNPKQLRKNIDKAHQLLNSVPVEIINQSVFDIQANSEAWLYLDPPYYKVGESLYEYGAFDHRRLAEELYMQDKWVLSYDYVPEVLGLYHWANVTPVDVVSHMHHKPIKDVVITP